MTRVLLAILLLALPQGKQIPPPGVQIPAADRTELEAGVKQLGAEIDALKSKHADLMPDVQIYHKASTGRSAMTSSSTSRRSARRRICSRSASSGRSSSPTESRRGRRHGSDSARLCVEDRRLGPALRPGRARELQAGGDHRHRLDFWLHGRGETSRAVVRQRRQKSVGEFAPADTIVLHLYGRFCNASKFAGEVDLFEALESVKKRYPIDENRLVVRGFSMGGASTWHIAAHHAGVWAAANPGAGFAETPIYAGISKESVKDAPWQATLWHWYNATDYAVNLFNCPVVAYSGELDKQKQAADIMAKAMKDEGLDLIHVIGPKTEHKYEPEAKKDVAKRVDEFAAKGRDPNPKKIRFATWTLRYNQMKWLTVDGLEKHWERATVDVENNGGLARATTKNVSALTIGGLWKQVEIDGQIVTGNVPLKKVDGKWMNGTLDDGLRKRHGLQGPIDDAFMDSFVFVIPTGKPMHEKTGAWIAAEQARAVEMWRKFFRGDARVIKDDAVTSDVIASSNLVFWGDPQSNKLLEGVVEKLPIKWTPKEITAGAQKFPADSHVPVLIYPNPLNPKRYVVLNSGFTFQDQAPASNSRHVPMLPDWAVMDVGRRRSRPPTSSGRNGS
jgi:dienelactone hydrolase